MLKFVFALIFAASAASPLLALITPEQLRTHFYEIKDTMNVTQITYFGYMYFSVRNNYNDQIAYAKINLTLQMETYVNAYAIVVEAILRNVEEGTDILECVVAVNEKVINLGNDIVMQTMKNLITDVDKTLDKLYKFFITTLRSFKELAEEILSCEDPSCATELDATLSEYYENFNDGLSEMAPEINIIDEEIREHHFDETYYAEQILSFIEEVKLCKNETKNY